MKTHFGAESWQVQQRTVATVGNFDGVHLGHQLILQTVAQRALQHGLVSVAVTFDPIPKKILNPQGAPRLIQTLRQRLRSLEQQNLDHVIVLEFNKEFSNVSPVEFIQDYLVGLLKTREFIVGENFSFGHQKKGNIALLKELGEKNDFVVQGIPEVKMDGVRISSSIIRQKISEGKIEEANKFMGRTFTLEGTIAKGERTGSVIGFPTANLETPNELLPANGVYISRMQIDEVSHASVTNVGFRPTFGGRRLTVEAHLIDFEGDLYGREVELQFLRRLREESKFNSVELLQRQIRADVENARTYFHLQQARSPRKHGE